MKPVSYQRMPSAVNGGHPPFDRVLSIPNVMHCEKCGYASLDAAEFKRHLDDHTGTRFYCFYCNHVSFSEAELSTHLKQHTEKYPFKCPHCGQGYMRRLCLVKHIDRLHGNGGRSGPPKPGMTKAPQVPVSSAFPSLPTADPLPLRPVVRVTVPGSSSAALRLGKDDLRTRALDTNASNVANRNTELLSPLNGHIQHNRALTVSLPEEVSIPAGCLVELVEVKTVNGTKELKLRLISQQENESVIKDTRTVASPNTAQEKQLSSMLHSPITGKTLSLGTCAINKTPYETKTVSVERPVVVKHQPSQMSNNKVGLKRNIQEIINLECQTVPPSKIPKSLSPHSAFQGNGGMKVLQRDTVNHNTPVSSVMPTRVVNRLTNTQPLQSMAACVSQRAVEEKRNSLPEQAKTTPPRRSSDIKSIPRDVSLPLKLESRDGHLKNSVTSSGVLPPAPGQRRTSPVLVCKDKIVSQSFLLPRMLNGPLSYQTRVLSNDTKPKISIWKQEVKCNDRAGQQDVREPESFPVISSVFSLSQQPEDVQGPIQPLVMALRGIVMDKSKSSASTTEDRIRSTESTVQEKETPPSENRAAMDSKPLPLNRDPPSTDKTSESVKVEEHHKAIQHPLHLSHSCVKIEKDDTGPTGSNKCDLTPDSKPLKDVECVSKIATNADVSATAEPKRQTAENENSISSKVLTVSLKRVQLGVWKNNNKGLKFRISKHRSQVSVGSLTDCTVIHPMPLKVDQLVKRPGPNQPVVVLNHPKPRLSAQGAGAVASAHMGASEVVPKCQILKMRLSKVMGQKYEVKGCTVGVSQ